ncbi:MAG: hypothetical protein MSA53_07260, partial [Bacteroidales bacterium]|nr:hypothetical protein [Bacteroidales bacterium]
LVCFSYLKNNIIDAIEFSVLNLPFGTEKSVPKLRDSGLPAMRLLSVDSHGYIWHFVQILFPVTSQISND